MGGGAAGPSGREAETMRTLALTDHDLSQADYSNFETNLQHRGAALRAGVTAYTTPRGDRRARLANPAVEFDEAQASAQGLEEFCQTYGFHRRLP
jgi:hypothetical protein